MNDDSLAALQPDAGGTEPVAPVTPDPVVPDIPVVPEAEDGKLNEVEQAEADEWDAAEKELFPGLRKSEEEKKEDEQDDKDKKPEAPETPKEGDKGDEPPKSTDEESPKDDAPKEQEDEPVEPDGATARLSAREEAAQVEAVKNDVREKLFPDVVTELKDADGDPIKSIADVMKLINPNTGEQFTEEQAGMFLIQAQNQLKENLANVDQQVNQIADVNIDLKDQADVVNYQYGELLKAMPEVRDKVWAQYEKTLTKDPKTGIITKAPVSLQQFYETALEPYAELGRQLAQQENNDAAAKEKAAADARVAEEAKKTQIRQDRSDIYAKGKVDTQTEEDKEWGAAAEAVFGPRT